VTQTWILKASRFGFYAATVADCPSISRAHTPPSLQYVGQERVEVVTVRVENTRRVGALSSFGAPRITRAIDFIAERQNTQDTQTQAQKTTLAMRSVIVCVHALILVCVWVCADIQLTTEEYRRLEASTLNRLNEIKNRIAAQRSSVFGADFAKELRARQGQEGRFWPLPRQQDGQQQEPEACMGCSRPATVKISKKCETCPERAEVRRTQP
jgi:hypothetical protein